MTGTSNNGISLCMRRDISGACEAHVGAFNTSRATPTHTTPKLSQSAMIEAITTVTKENDYQNVIYDSILNVNFPGHFQYILLSSYIGKLLEGKIRDFSDGKRQVLLRSYYH